MARPQFAGYPAFLEAAAIQIGHPDAAGPASRITALTALSHLCAQAVLAEERPLAPHYRLELRREGPLDAMDVVVECRDEGVALGAAEREALAARAQHRIKAYIGLTTTVRVVEPGAIERSAGKAKRVVDLRPKT